MGIDRCVDRRVRMKDPLQDFDWASLYRTYDARCHRFEAESPHLEIFGSDRPKSDRELYYRLVQQFSKGPKKFGERAFKFYRALLYWKLYSQGTCDSTIAASLAQPKEPLLELLKELPTSLERKPDNVLDLIDVIREFGILGMKGRSDSPFSRRSLISCFHALCRSLTRWCCRRSGSQTSELMESAPCCASICPSPGALPASMRSRLPPSPESRRCGCLIWHSGSLVVTSLTRAFRQTRSRLGSNQPPSHMKMMLPAEFRA